jgi:hypothetical protein
MPGYTARPPSLTDREKSADGDGFEPRRTRAFKFGAHPELEQKVTDVIGPHPATAREGGDALRL